MTANTEPRLREWQLRLLYKQLRATQPHIIMHGLSTGNSGGCMGLMDTRTNKYRYVFTHADIADLLNAGPGEAAINDPTVVPKRTRKEMLGL